MRRFLSIHLLANFGELGYFRLKHLLSHLLTDTISVDDQIRWSLALMILLEKF